MPIITVLGLPGDVSQDTLARLMRRIQQVVSEVSVLDVPANDVSVSFPADRLKEGLGEELIAKIEGLYEKPERTPEVLQNLRVAIHGCLEKFALTELPQCTYVEAFVNTTIRQEDCTHSSLVVIRCPECRGRGGSGSDSLCPYCKGSGRKPQIVEIRELLGTENTHAEQAISETLALLLPRQDELHQGGFVCVRDAFTNEILFLVQAGEIEIEAGRLKRYELAQEKTERHAKHPGHLTSRRSRDPENGKWGGSIAATPRLLVAFSGFPEADDEVFAMVFSSKMSWLESCDVDVINNELGHEKFNEIPVKDREPLQVAP